MKKTAKKAVALASSLLMSLALAGVASAGPAPTENQPKVVWRIGGDLETVAVQPSSGENAAVYTVFDHNPDNYSKRTAGGHVLESWLKDGIVYTAVDGTVSKTYALNAGLQVVPAQPGSTQNNPEYIVVDRNPANYQARSGFYGSPAVVESWLKNGTVYTAVNGTVASTYRIGGDLERSLLHSGDGENGPEYVVIDHNPGSYSERNAGSQTIKSWLEGDVVYTEVKK